MCCIANVGRGDPTHRLAAGCGTQPPVCGTHICVPYRVLPNIHCRGGIYAARWAVGPGTKCLPAARPVAMPYRKMYFNNSQLAGRIRPAWKRITNAPAGSQAASDGGVLMWNGSNRAESIARCSGIINRRPKEALGQLRRDALFGMITFLT